ncbi:MAG TPA: hypothetical protein VFA81_05275 [Burkholderiales bacterium]|nr:hypothetical protein [Burkholderiales bacterium]
MKVGHGLLSLAVAAILSFPVIAAAADDQPSSKPKAAAKSKPKRHDHNAENKASAPGQPADPASGPVKPAHDHRKENKGGG